MAVLAVQELVRDGAVQNLTLTGAAASDTITNATEREVLLTLSMNAVALTATIAPGGTGVVATGNGTLLAPQAQTRTLGNAQPSLGAFGPFRTSKFGTAPVITPSSPTSLSYALVRFPNS